MAETESIIAAQDQALKTKFHATKYYKQKTDSKCCLCQKYKAICHWCKHVPELVETRHEGKVLRNQQGQTNRTIPKNILGNTNHDNEEHIRYYMMQFQETEM